MQSNNVVMPTNRLAYFPINLFGAVMGFSGLSLGLLKASQLGWLPSTLFISLSTLTILLFGLFTGLYLFKMLKFPSELKHDIEHPVAVNFFPAFSISLLLLSLIVNEFASPIAAIMWYMGMIFHLTLTVVLLSSWMHHEKWQITHMNPAWFIPVVGNIVVPLGAVHFSNLELGWFFFSIGLVFWIVLFAIVMYRMFFHAPLLKILEPTLFILIAPPAIGFLSYLALNGGVLDAFARILYYTALFMTLLLMAQLPRFIKIPYALSWWAYSFPIAAITLASMTMFILSQLTVFAVISAALLGALIVLITLLSVKTLIAVKHGTLCKPHPVMPTKPSASDK
ncbi:transporter [Thiosulfatimonas sediminis]|uniref:Transporter n=1 Tax=Thiosulfatimonas sediminis TaxID=2675054 RepID=A0A6F8PV43_9GAMM|nr:SLAC1 anion channel family protein [Thiosulfatimonas sediminis]BBP45966.1 transporter [Thiosulfatimonas sediminis]